MRRLGFSIHDNKRVDLSGYQNGVQMMPQTSDPFEETRVALAGTAFADVRYTPTTGSTNEDALRLFDQGNCDGTTLVTDFQTKGSGRKGRRWIAPPRSSLLFTTLLPVTLDAGVLWAVPFWCGLAVKRALKVYGIEADLQWPNDVLLGTRKVAGILCSSRGIGARSRAACGVGINVIRTPDSYYRDIEPPPAFLNDAAVVDRAALLATILRQFAASLENLADAEGIARQWEHAARLPGTMYRLVIDGQSQAFDAVAQRLGTNGSLVVTRDGREQEILLADARVLR